MKGVAALISLLLAGAGCTRTNVSYVGPAFDLPDLAVEEPQPDLAGFDLTGFDLTRPPRDLARPSPDLAGRDLAGLDLLTPPIPDLLMPPDLRPFVGCGDGVCGGGETCATCQVDCGGCNACPDGFADCNNSSTDGCETDVRTLSHCGGCNNACVAAGGTIQCVPKGDTYMCQPSCDATHQDCDSNPSNGCEANLTTNGNCGGCGILCESSGGTNACVAGGGGYACSPSCDATHANCDGEPSNGCEATIDDTHETSDNSCAGEQNLGDLDEGMVGTLSADRILPANDVDIFQVRFVEATHSDCTFLATQSYTGFLRVTAPAGVTLSVRGGPFDFKNATGTCDNTWTPSGNATCVPLAWNGTCGFTDRPIISIKVDSPNGTSSCVPYKLEIGYCALGMTCIPSPCN